MYEERVNRGLSRVRERIAAALERRGRSDEVRLVAVTKGHPVAAVEAAWAAGLGDVGENRVRELEEKRGRFPPGEPGPRWHLIGHLQRNKARRAVALSDHIHSVDSLRLARELSKEGERSGTRVRVLVQVNASGEASKGGFDAAAAVDEIGEVVALPGLVCEGLMTMAPLTTEEAVIRRTFAATRDLLDRCVGEGLALAGRELSMGMSGDYEVAIEEGSTMIRLGTVLFGEREP